MKKMLFGVASTLFTTAIVSNALIASAVPTNSWTIAPGGDITQSTITGGPWTLGQGPNTVTLPSVDYCQGGVPQKNPFNESQIRELESSERSPGHE